MKKKLLLLLFRVIIIYYLIHIAYDLPNIANGRFYFKWIPLHASEALLRVMDLACSSLFALLPFWILHRLYPARRIVRIVLLITVSVAVLFFMHYGVARLQYGATLRLRYYFLNTLFYIGVYLFYGILFYFTGYAHDKEMEQKDLLLQNRQSELSFLRSQVNPHFLFNSLNNIYSLVYENSPKALPAIAGLSQLMRYMLYDGNDRVPLQKELDYIKQYIELQGIRFEHAITTRVHVSGETGQVHIPALLLIAFVENAFKHGDFAEGSEGLVITVYSSLQKTQFYCRNQKGHGPKDAGGGIGLVNVKRRLELLYPGKHLLEIEDIPDSFTIHLELTHG
ncbi:Histidine kinase [Filimonas lacunae]|uniref:Histidine kinase n=1 Tax=Filimonas lacunae TaxID=477680 RepID=A0A173MJL8_9BACT|nr:histidine kinase [Filimonas lacunae]BAV07588.1 two-component system sensor protein, no kinase domain [Filimonas lacunae]SIT29863.1 Histidine kinase [Filimonas lacunae]